MNGCGMPGTLGGRLRPRTFDVAGRGRNDGVNACAESDDRDREGKEKGGTHWGKGCRPRNRASGGISAIAKPNRCSGDNDLTLILAGIVPHTCPARRTHYRR